MSEFIKSFKQLSKNDVAIAGGKGASLGEMTQTKIPVPPGFVVLAPAFDRFLDKTDLGVEIEAAMHKVNHKDIKSVEQASKKIRDLIYDAEFPEQLGKEILNGFTELKAKYVAVRSSATAEDSSIASWAGELETYLNVTQKNLLESVKKCWSSLFTPRAIFYRFEKGLHKQAVSVAVVVQAMIQSEISGICFTVHPVTEDRDQMVIEAGYGLGEAIVGGEITPDTYIIHKKDWCLLDINISEQNMMITQCLRRGVKRAKVPQSKQEKQKLTNQQILKLAKLCQKIEEHYKVPQDIEWCLDSGRFYVVQSRPITTL
ncbi:hypothetical protein MYX07_00075 [Patescibacteria group bacterium AH-259-L07]|nr:hypothetical protein [Patescibacteria group bacterium AH-259-L07]